MRDAARQPVLHLVFALLPHPRLNSQRRLTGIRRASAHSTPQCEGANVEALAGAHGEGTVPLWVQLALAGGAEQLLGPHQDGDSTWSSTWNTVSTRPASSFAFLSDCAAASSSRTVAPIRCIRVS